MEKLSSVCTSPPEPPHTHMPQSHMHSTLISRGDVLMTHLSSHFIDAGPSVATVVIKKEAKLDLPIKGRMLSII